MSVNNLLEATCFNILNANLVCKYDDFSSNDLFSLLFLHLIESKGLDSLINRERYHENRISKEKNNNHLISIMKAIYHHKNKTEEERIILKRYIGTIINKVTANDTLISKIQLLIATLLSGYIIDDTLEESLDSLLQIKRLLVEDDF